jgi:NAD+ synthase
MKMNCELYLEALRRRVDELGIKKATLGLSGGKDSNIVAKLMVDILGPDNVIGVMIPNGAENDTLAIELSKMLGINTLSCDIADSFNSMMDNLTTALHVPEIDNGRYDSKVVSEDTRINIAPRLRMTVLYAVAQSIGDGCRVIGTTNRSENFIGWLTKWGDGGADFEPIINLTVRELHELGAYIGLPEKFVKRVPVDGLTPKTDEDRFGFTYTQLDDYIESAKNNCKGTCGNIRVDEKIEKMHRNSNHKRAPIPTVEY